MSNEELVKLIQSGVNQRDNMQRLYEQNIGFINSLIKQYSYACHSYNRHARKLNKIDNETSPIGVIEYNELLQEAFIGLCNAVKGYDESMDCTFLTYSAYWIRQAIKRFLENCGNTIRVPVWLQARINYYNRIQSHYMSKYGRKATIEEIADIMGVSKKVVEKLELYMYRSSEPMSLDAPLTAEDGAELTIADSVADSSANVEESVIEDVVNEEVSRVWDEVSRILKNPTMKDIILYRYRDNMTLKEIGDILGMTAESVRHYENKGLRRLRSNAKTKRLFAMIA